MILVITTLPHFYSILPLIKYYKHYTGGYVNIIVLSTVSSILYHMFEESNRIINAIDYLFAGIWFLYDLYMGYTYTNKRVLSKIFIGNTIVFIINIYTIKNVSYELNHSLWHLINSYKCIYVSNHINKALEAYTKLPLNHVYRSSHPRAPIICSSQEFAHMITR